MSKCTASCWMCLGSSLWLRHTCPPKWKETRPKRSWSFLQDIMNKTKNENDDLKDHPGQRFYQDGLGTDGWLLWWYAGHPDPPTRGEAITNLWKEVEKTKYLPPLVPEKKTSWGEAGKNRLRPCLWGPNNHPARYLHRKLPQREHWKPPHLGRHVWWGQLRTLGSHIMSAGLSVGGKDCSSTGENQRPWRE